MASIPFAVRSRSVMKVTAKEKTGTDMANILVAHCFMTDHHSHPNSTLTFYNYIMWL